MTPRALRNLAVGLGEYLTEHCTPGDPRTRKVHEVASMVVATQIVEELAIKDEQYDEIPVAPV